MAGGLSTYEQLWKGVQLRCPAAPTFLARQWIDFRFRKLWDRKLWSWQRKTGQFIFDAAYGTGTVACTRGSFTVTGVGTAWTTDLNAHQFRIGLNAPIYTILNVTSATTLDLTEPWGAPSSTGTTYSIYNAYQTVPSDFEKFDVVIDTL